MSRGTALLLSLPAPATQEAAAKGSLEPLHAGGDARQLAMCTGSIPGFFNSFFFFFILQNEIKQLN